MFYVHGVELRSWLAVGQWVVHSLPLQLQHRCPSPHPLGTPGNADVWSADGDRGDAAADAAAAFALRCPATNGRRPIVNVVRFWLSAIFCCLCVGGAFRRLMSGIRLVVGNRATIGGLQRCASRVCLSCSLLYASSWSFIALLRASQLKRPLTRILPSGACVTASQHHSVSNSISL